MISPIGIITIKAKITTPLRPGETSVTLMPLLMASMTSGGGGREPYIAGNNMPAPNAMAITLSKIAKNSFIMTLPVTHVAFVSK